MEANYFTILYWFCHTSRWIRQGCTRVPNSEPPSRLPPLRVIPVHQPQASCILHRTWTGDLFHIWYYTCFNATNWKILALQCCVGFCHITTRISNKRIYGSHSNPLGCDRVPGWAPCALQRLPLAVCFTHGSVNRAMLLSRFIPPSPSSAVFTSRSLCLHLHAFPAGSPGKSTGMGCHLPC